MSEQPQPKYFNPIAFTTIFNATQPRAVPIQFRIAFKVKEVFSDAVYFLLLIPVAIASGMVDGIRRVIEDLN